VSETDQEQASGAPDVAEVEWENLEQQPDYVAEQMFR
jgi:hypothetical protein